MQHQYCKYFALSTVPVGITHRRTDEGIDDVRQVKAAAVDSALPAHAFSAFFSSSCITYFLLHPRPSPCCSLSLLLVSAAVATVVTAAAATTTIAAEQ